MNLQTISMRRISALSVISLLLASILATFITIPIQPVQAQPALELKVEPKVALLSYPILTMNVSLYWRVPGWLFNETRINVYRPGEVVPAYTRLYTPISPYKSTVYNMTRADYYDPRYDGWVLKTVPDPKGAAAKGVDGNYTLFPSDFPGAALNIPGTWKFEVMVRAVHPGTGVEAWSRSGIIEFTVSKVLIDLADVHVTGVGRGDVVSITVKSGPAYQNKTTIKVETPTAFWWRNVTEFRSIRAPWSPLVPETTAWTRKFPDHFSKWDSSEPGRRVPYINITGTWRIYVIVRENATRQVAFNETSFDVHPLLATVPEPITKPARQEYQGASFTIKAAGAWSTRWLNISVATPETKTKFWYNKTLDPAVVPGPISVKFPDDFPGAKTEEIGIYAVEARIGPPGQVLETSTTDFTIVPLFTVSIKPGRPKYATGESFTLTYIVKDARGLMPEDLAKRNVPTRISYNLTVKDPRGIVLFSWPLPPEKMYIEKLNTTAITPPGWIPSDFPAGLYTFAGAYRVDTLELVVPEALLNSTGDVAYIGKIEVVAYSPLDVLDRLTALEERVATIKEEILPTLATKAALESEIRAVKEDIAKVRDDLTKAKEVLATDIAELSAKVDAVEGRVKDVEARLTEQIVGVTTIIYVAIVLALIAALASVASVILLRRR